eukprot:8356112-Pyramimonas_sp.AAC.1
MGQQVARRSAAAQRARVRPRALQAQQRRRPRVDRPERRGAERPRHLLAWSPASAPPGRG